MTTSKKYLLLPNQEYYIRLLLGFIFIWFFDFSVYGQAQIKKTLEATDYNLWGTLYLEQVSKNGNWTSYKMNYNSVSDTLYIKKRDGKRLYRFATIANGSFCGEKYYAFLEENKTLIVLNLNTGIQKEIRNIQAFEFSVDEKCLITHEINDDKRSLVIRKADGLILKVIDNVISYSLNKFNDDLLSCISEPNSKKVILQSLKNLESQELVAEERAGVFTKFTWQQGGRNVAFIHQLENIQEKVTKNQVYFYQPASKNRYVFDSDKLKEHQKAKRISDPVMSRLTISDNGEKVFFGIEAIQKEELFNKDSLQIWSGNDITVYSEQKQANLWKTLPSIVAWSPKTDSLLQLSTSERPVIFFNGNYEYCITYALDKIGPQYKLLPDVDYYITNLNTGATTLWISQQSTAMNNMSISPNGSYIAYYRDDGYWVYDFLTNKHTNVTKQLDVKWQEDDVLGVSSNYGIAGWTNNDETLLIYDKNDLWAINVNGKTAKRITDGYKNHCVYRLVALSFDTVSRTFQREKGKSINFNNSVLFKYNTDTENGYRILKPDEKWYTIEIGEMAVSNIQKASHNNTYIYLTQRYNKPPTIQITDKNSSNPNSLVQSNLCHYNYLWGYTEVVEYKNSEGENLKGILYYPAGYENGKKYPMIVNIYDKQLHYLHSYINPSEENIIGFNVTNFTTKGYFVLRPDIVYEKDNPGGSATDCTVAATKAVIQKGIVKEDKIGLIGHSFGGYETNIIITQTNLFAAAVSGAGISDIISFYLSIGEITGVPEIFRFENQQWRMKQPLFDNVESYLQNSPVIKAKQVKTPLLLWTGERDNQVNYNQSVSYYLALRRLGKKQILLVYPNEGHVVLQPGFQKDLTLRIQDWFDYYLKDKQSSQWIINGIK